MREKENRVPAGPEDAADREAQQQRDHNATSPDEVQAAASPEAWATKITAAWRKTLEAIFETGDALIEAKAALGHGNFQKMFDENERQVPFSISTAERLMKVARDSRLRHSALGPILPPHWRVLYELTKWSNESLDRAFREGLIHSEMSKADAVNLLTAKRPAPPLLNALGRPIAPPTEDYGPNKLQIFLEILEAYFEDAPKIELFRRGSPRDQWQSWGVEIAEEPATRTLKLKVRGDYFIIRVPARTSIPTLEMAVAS